VIKKDKKIKDVLKVIRGKCLSRSNAKINKQVYAWSKKRNNEI
jgi:hypothetical protein